MSGYRNRTMFRPGAGGHRVPVDLQTSEIAGFLHGFLPVSS
jgi:hypothetical protein